MSQVLSDKKNLDVRGYFSDENKNSFQSFFKGWKKHFKVYRRDNSEIAQSYIMGLMKCEKNHTNMERMAEQIPDQSYHQYYNFLSESKWDYKEVNKQVALETSALMQSCKARNGKPTGYIIDESSHLKKVPNPWE